MKYFQCFDIGGTYIKYGVISSEGNILDIGKIDTPKENGKVEIPLKLIKKIKKAQCKWEIIGVGISTAGQVDSEKGQVVFATDNIPGYSGTMLSSAIEEGVQLPCFVENDVNAAALGELWKGAAVGKSNFVCITLGTGIGGAIIINGQLYKGVGGGAGELGHMIIKKNGKKCTCGGRGCYERYASTSALLRYYSKSASEKIGKEETVSGETFMSKVKAGEPLALEVYKDFIDNLVVGLTSIVHILDPGLIVIGGGISAQGEIFFKALRDNFYKKVMSSYGARTKILPAKLENNAGLLGACYGIKNLCDD
jgi:glucokinase